MNDEEKTVPLDPLAFQDVLAFDADGLTFRATWINGYWSMVGRKGIGHPEFYRVYLPSDASQEDLVGGWWKAKEDAIIINHFLPKRHPKHKRLQTPAQPETDTSQETPGDENTVVFDAAGLTFRAVRMEGHWQITALNETDVVEIRKVCVPDDASKNALLAGWWKAESSAERLKPASQASHSAGELQQTPNTSEPDATTYRGASDAEIIFYHAGLTFQAIRKLGYWRMMTLQGGKVIETHQVFAPAGATPKALLAGWRDAKAASNPSV